VTDFAALEASALEVSGAIATLVTAKTKSDLVGDDVCVNDGWSFFFLFLTLPLLAPAGV